MSVNVFFQVDKLSAGIAEVLLHDRQHLIELAQVGLGKVEALEVFVDGLLGKVLQHGVAPAEVRPKTLLIVDLEFLEGNAVAG